MTVAALDWERLIRDAQEVTHPEGPKNLIAILADAKRPFENRGEFESRSDDLWRARKSDLGPVDNYRQSGKPLADDDRAVWLDRLAWLLEELEACKHQRPDLPRISAILCVSRAFSFDKPIWERLPSTYFGDTLFASMAGLVGATRCEFRSSGHHEPIWEQEAVDAFLQADRDDDWLALEDRWQTIAPAIWPDEDLAAATACLCSADKGVQALALAVDQFDSILPMISVASVMNPHQIGKVAPRLASFRGRFALVQSMAFNHPRNEALPSDTLRRLATLFQTVQQDVAEWDKWMKALNRYPVRTKALQPAFGLSLAGSTSEAKAAYVEAIKLSTSHGECREAVTECLATFAQKAEVKERREFWRLVHNRWAAWNFGERAVDRPLVQIAVSELDYGVVGYLLENLDENDRAESIKLACDAINNVAQMWHRSVIEHNSNWYRALSNWFVLKYGQQVAAGEADWRPPSSFYLPFDPKKDRYLAMTYPTRS